MIVYAKFINPSLSLHLECGIKISRGVSRRKAWWLQTNAGVVSSGFERNLRFKDIIHRRMVDDTTEDVPEAGTPCSVWAAAPNGEH